MRNFNVVKPDDGDSPTFPTQAAGEIFVKISGFENQAEFQREFPRHSTVAIFDLNDGKKPVKRVIEYIKKDGGTMPDGDGGTLYSWLPSNKETAGDAVIKLLRPLAVEECFLLSPFLGTELKNLIVSEQWNKRETGEGSYTKRQAGLNPKGIIYKRYGNYKTNVASNTDENEEAFPILTERQRIFLIFSSKENTAKTKREKRFLLTEWVV